MHGARLAELGDTPYPAAAGARARVTGLGAASTLHSMAGWDERRGSVTQAFDEWKLIDRDQRAFLRLGLEFAEAEYDRRWKEAGEERTGTAVQSSSTRSRSRSTDFGITTSRGCTSPACCVTP